jgi:hypothetical protein
MIRDLWIKQLGLPVPPGFDNDDIRPRRLQLAATECPLSKGDLNRSTQHWGPLPINNDEGLPNARPIAFSRNPSQPAIPQRNFLCRPATTTKSLTYRPIIDLFHLRASVASTG